MARPTVRLGAGGMAPAGPSIGARWAYLEAVRHVVPECLDSLVTIAADVIDGSPAAEDGLRAWCARWGLTARWCHDAARATARLLAGRAPTDPLIWFGVTGSYWIPGAAIAPPAWRPDRETEAAFRARVETYIADMREAATAAGWTPIAEKRTGDHFAWLARYQTGGWTLARIAENYQDADGYPDVPAVSKAITATAALIGLPLRPARGRRRTLP